MNERGGRATEARRGWGGRLLWVGALACWSVAGAAEAVSWESQGLVAGGWESNPLEWIEKPHRGGDGFIRVEVGLRFLEGTPGEATRLAGGLRWGSDRYHRERTENRQILQGDCTWSHAGARHGVSVFGRALARFYPHQSDGDRALQGDRDLLRLEGGVRGRWVFPSGRSLHAQLAGLALRKEALVLTGIGGDPQAREEIGRSRHGAQLSVEMRAGLHPGWQWLGRGEVGRIVHDREAVGQPVDASIRGKGERRSDTTWLLGLTLRRLQMPVLDVSAAFVRAESNSFAVGSQRLLLEATAGILLPAGVSGHLMARWHPVTHYDEDARSVDPYEDPDDPEFGERNRVALRLVKPVARGLSLELQGTWERNEALVLLDYYEKTQLWAGVRFTGR